MAPPAVPHSTHLSSGHDAPLLGLGCWQSKNTNAVEVALDAGYRHIDTAYLYLNEPEVGENIARWIEKGGGTREEIFVTTKLPMIAMRPADVDKFLRKSLERLGLDYVDLYLVHAPIGMKPAHDDDVIPMDENNRIRVDYSTDLIAVWKAMEATVDAGLSRSIGVSNYSIPQLRKTLAVARIQPAMQQIELHVRYQQPTMVQYCQQHSIALTAYGALGSPGRKHLQITSAKLLPLMEDPVVLLVAQNHSVTAAQVLVRFWVQQGICVVPKSINPERIVTNGMVFEWQLTELEMAALKTLDDGPDGKTFLIGEDSAIRSHPEFAE